VGLDEIMNDSGAKSDVQNFIAGGGRVIMSFGGADGQYLESACSSTCDVQTSSRNVIDTQEDLQPSTSTSRVASSIRPT